MNHINFKGIIQCNACLFQVTIRGSNIKGLLEEYAAQLCPTADCYATTFLQVSGLRVVYTILEDNIGDR